eukprot:2601722-Rhodomonas_salina.1
MMRGHASPLSQFCNWSLFTDLMNVINALQAWSRHEFLRDMTRQLNADIMNDLLLAINDRSAQLHIVKVK